MTKVVTEYRLVSRSDESMLVARVNELITDGWQPLGGVGSELYDLSRHVQAMVKYDYSQDDIVAESLIEILQHLRENVG